MMPNLSILNYQKQLDMVLHKVSQLKEPMKIGPFYNKLIEKEGLCMGFRSLKRYIDELAEREIIQTEVSRGGQGGSTTLIVGLKGESA